MDGWYRMTSSHTSLLGSTSPEADRCQPTATTSKAIQRQKLGLSRLFANALMRFGKKTAGQRTVPMNIGIALLTNFSANGPMSFGNKTEVPKGVPMNIGSVS